MFTVNSTLETVTIASNDIGMEGGKQIQEGVQRNNTLKSIDLRLTGVGPDAEETVTARLAKNTK